MNCANEGMIPGNVLAERSHGAEPILIAATFIATDDAINWPRSLTQKN